MCNIDYTKNPICHNVPTSNPVSVILRNPNNICPADRELFLQFQKSKEKLSKTDPDLYYALLKWKDVHLKEFRDLIEDD